MVSSSGLTGHIAVDAMGGDLGPPEVVAAVELALSEFTGLNPITLVGDEAVLKPLITRHGLDGHPSLRLFHASEVITMDDKPLLALKRKKDASMFRAIELVKSGEASAVVSCGNTGALMAGGTIKLRTLAGIDRPALAAIIPRENGHFILIDAGANPEAEAEHLVHNALLGTHYARVVLGIAAPRVGLLTIGTEEGKGNALISATHEHLKSLGNLINYVGPTEGFQVFTDHCDVAVCDGFVGNLLLKSWESLAHFFSATLKSELKANPLRMGGAMLSRGAFKALKKRMNPDVYGGAPLLGLRGNVLKAHGSSSRHAIKNAIHAVSKIVKADMLHLIEADAARANALIRPPQAASAAKLEAPAT
ncbi:MAG: fatty acid synthesis protein PlsX [Rariglobus sp.]|jgi:glycerol-3-phosphate acyltransferase PlsX|nr:fatty acid synthesis protein PlsX [Rariglobus sp.]